MKKQALTLAIAAALSAPSALAAQDTSGMRYTSAAEGFYASIRVVWSSKGSAQDDFNVDGTDSADIGSNWSRFGVRGTNDLGGGLEGFYQYETRINLEQGSNPDTRLMHVGLRGNFGEVVAGTFWNNLYNFSYSATDVANNHSAHFVSSSNRGDAARALPNRINSALQYTTPDLNGFKGSVLVVSDNKTTPGSATGKDENTIDSWGLAAKYDVQGFSLGATYWTNADALRAAPITDALQTALRALPNETTNSTVTNAKQDDMATWTVKGGYSQDNWYVSGWYGQTNLSDLGNFVIDAQNNDLDGTVKFKDTTYTSLAAGVTVDKVALYGVYEMQEVSAQSGIAKVDNKDRYATLGAQYNLGSNSRVFVEYNNQDLDSNKDADDRFEVGLRHDF